MRHPDLTRHGLPFDEWPLSDQRAWHALLDPGADILGDRGAGCDWAAATQVAMRSSYGQWLGWRQRTDPDSLQLSIAARVTPPVVGAWVDRLAATVAPLTVRLRVQHLLGVVAGVEPERDWTWLRRIVRRLDRRAYPIRVKRARLRGTDEIYALGASMMFEASRSSTPDWRDAQRFRDGLMLALLASRPLRLRNYSAIEIGRHLVRRHTGFECRFESNETKNGQEIEFPVPDALNAALESYLNIYRPLLRSRAADPVDTNYLWICRKGTPMERAALYERIVTLTQRELGVRINPHLFRDCAATSIALEDPEHVRITRSILGHSTLRTSERHYNHANANQAAQRYQRHVLRLRREAIDDGKRTASITTAPTKANPRGKSLPAAAKRNRRSTSNESIAVKE